MQPTRLRQLNSIEPKSNGSCVIYVMSRDQRAHDNHALLLAQQDALKRQLPLIVVFNFLSKTGVRAREHYQFMIDGLVEVQSTLSAKNISFVITTGNPETELLKVISELGPTAIYFDFSPLKGPTKLRSYIASKAGVACYEVDTHNIIPAWVVSDHQEFAAHTFRPKVHRLLIEYLIEPDVLVEHPNSFAKKLNAKTFEDISRSISEIPSNGTTISFKSGEKAAATRLDQFIALGLERFALDRNDPTLSGLSDLSPYLHFGQISSLRVALEVMAKTGVEPLLFSQAKMPESRESASAEDGMNSLFEEMIVRKELSDNFCLYAKSYTDFSSAADWAKKTLSEHQKDKREFTYSRDEWENAKTHDLAWNAAQIQLRTTGKIHGYMRMYWAKKMLEWSVSPVQALADCIYLNDHYSIDGGDPNGYVGILWSLAGLHDRPWFERPVFGKIRYMNAAGLKRKFDVDSYINQQNPSK